MNKKNLLWLGLGAVALYLYFRNKPKVSAVTPNVAPPPSVLTTTKAPTLPALTPDKGLSQYDCNWVKNEIIKRDNYEKQISETIASFTSRGLPPPPIAYVQRPTYSIEQYEVAKKCGLNLPS